MYRDNYYRRQLENRSQLLRKCFQPNISISNPFITKDVKTCIRILVVVVVSRRTVVRNFLVVQTRIVGHEGSSFRTFVVNNFIPVFSVVRNDFGVRTSVDGRFRLGRDDISVPSSEGIDPLTKTFGCSSDVFEPFSPYP